MRPTDFSNRRGVSLLEVLIVGSTISIAAAVSAPWYIESAVRAGLARNRADYQMLRAGILAYALDHQGWPSSEDGVYADHSADMNLSELTTPLPYLTSVPHLDPFTSGNAPVVEPGSWGPNKYQYYNFCHYGSGSCGTPLRSWDGEGQVWFRDWLIFSAGPSGMWPPGFRIGLEYDASNGTISPGIVWTSEAGMFGEGRYD
jgi:type II secretory pathway pseudopilin PulG